MISLFFLLLYSCSALAQSGQQPNPRWGAASTLVNNILFVHGGKINPTNGASYSSAPVISDLLTLDLSLSFDTSSPPWSNVSSSGPAVAFHTLTAYSASSALLFGGVPDPSLFPLVNVADSAWLLNLTVPQQPTWIPQALNWASEPVRTFHQTAVNCSGGVYIMGGMKGDQSAVIPNTFQFNPAPAFNDLSMTPPLLPIYGHATVALPDGRLITFGGINQQANLPLLSTIYVFNTSNSPPSWASTSASGSIPSPRRNFAATPLDDHRILIHGGSGDSANPPQSFLSDGFILDTSQDPMQWSAVENLNLLGQRSDHVSVASGSQVLFVFGWGQNGVVNSSVNVFDTSSNSFVDRWSPPLDNPPPSATAPGTSNPYPSTIGNQPVSSASSPNSPNPTQSFGPPATSGNASPHSLTVALATVFGVLALVAASGVAAYVAIKKREEKNGGAFYALSDGKSRDQGGGEGISPHNNAPIEKVHTAHAPVVPGVVKSPWSLLPLAIVGGRNAKNKGRVDMLGEEDSHNYDIEAFRAAPGSMGGRRPSGPKRDLSANSYGSSISNWYGVGSRRNWTDVVSNSLGNLMNVGSTSGRRGPSSQSEVPWWNQEAVPLDPFGDDMAVREDEAALHQGVTSLSMNNVSSLAAVGLNQPARPRGGMMGNSSSSFPYVDPISAVASSGEDPPAGNLPPQESGSGAAAESMTVDAARLSSSSVGQTSSNATDGSQSSHEQSNARPRSTSIIGASTAPSAPIRRSDSWWSRFSRTSLRDRQPEPPLSPHHGPSDALIDFRDPNPAPRLLPIKEGSQSSPDTADAVAGGSTDLPGNSTPKRRRSLSSLETTGTIDSEMIDRMAGRMDVVQRAATVSSRMSASSVPEDDTIDQETLLGLEGELIQSPTELDPDRPTQVGTFARFQGTGMVANRIQDWESKSQDDLQPQRDRRSLNYGLAPRASLYVANPDNSRNSST